MFAAPTASEIDELAERSESLEQRVASLYDSYETLKKREVELTEWRWVLTEAGGFFDRVRHLSLLIKAVTQADRLSRPLEMRMRFASQQIMTKRRSWKMSNNSQEDKMGMLQGNKPFQL